MNYPPLSLKISPSLESTQQKRLRKLFTKQTRKTQRHTIRRNPHGPSSRLAFNFFNSSAFSLVGFMYQPEETCACVFWDSCINSIHRDLMFVLVADLQRTNSSYGASKKGLLKHTLWVKTFLETTPICR